MVQKILIGLGLILLFILPVQASTTKINDLVEKAKELDGTTVTLQAEAIGEVLERGDHAWVNINDKSNAVGVYVPIAQAQKITFFGDYANTGDTVLITGIFHNACKEHGGELDVHAETITIVKIGSVTLRPVNPLKLAWFGLFALIALALGFNFYKAVKPNKIQKEIDTEETE